MYYERIHKAIFLARPNRFIAWILLDGEQHICHVKNTGRCRELLLPGVQVLVQHCPAPNRKTAYDLIAVWKGERLINMDAAAPNRVFAEWAAAGGLGFIPSQLQAECVHGDSRFDFYIEGNGQRGFAEIKGVTLEREGETLFPDAPTERGCKHLRGLAECVRQGYAAWAVFVIQMQGARSFRPNQATDPAFSAALVQAQAAGVRLLALDCRISERELWLRQPVPILLPGRETPD